MKNTLYAQLCVLAIEPLDNFPPIPGLSEYKQVHH